MTDQSEGTGREIFRTLACAICGREADLHWGGRDELDWLPSFGADRDSPINRPLCGECARKYLDAAGIVRLEFAVRISIHPR